MISKTRYIFIKSASFVANVLNILHTTEQTALPFITVFTSHLSKANVDITLQKYSAVWTPHVHIGDLSHVVTSKYLFDQSIIYNVAMSRMHTYGSIYWTEKFFIGQKIA